MVATRQVRRGAPGVCESGLVTRLQVSVQHVANPLPSAGRLARDRPTCYPHLVLQSHLR